MKLKIVFDNLSIREDLEAAWGFACVIEGAGPPVLFDTGCDAEILISNMEKMGVQPADVRAVVLSHSHYDHMGGLAGFARVCGEADVFFPQSSVSTEPAQYIQAHGLKAHYEDGGFAIRPGFFLVHTEGAGYREQSLAISTGDTSVLITGCAHPGIVNIAQKARETVGAPLRFVVGGLHLRGKDDESHAGIARELKALGVERIAAVHCTGASARSVLAREFADKSVSAGLGSEIDV